jgi:hypothetical protein
VWGGHSCPPPLGLFFDLFLTRAVKKQKQEQNQNSKTRTKTKINTNTNGSGQECPLHTN